VAQGRTEALVLRGVDFSETSRVVTFFSPERGRFACMAKGVRRAKSPLRGILDTFNRVELMYYWKDSRSVQSMGEASLLASYPGIKSDLAKSTYGGFVLELIDHLAHDNEPSDALFAETVRGLEDLDETTCDVRTACCRQVLRLLRAGGFGATTEHCSDCGKAISAPSWFSYGGGAVCDRCGGDVRLGSETMGLFARLLSDGPIDRDIVSPRLYDAIRHFAMRQLDVDFRSTRVIAQVYG